MFSNELLKTLFTLSLYISAGCVIGFFVFNETVLLFRGHFTFLKRLFTSDWMYVEVLGLGALFCAVFIYNFSMKDFNGYFAMMCASIFITLKLGQLLYYDNKFLLRLAKVMWKNTFQKKKNARLPVKIRWRMRNTIQISLKRVRWILLALVNWSYLFAGILLKMNGMV